MKICVNTACKTENPDDAKFCRKCGTPLPVTPSINWKETSLVKIQRTSGGYWVNLLLFSILVFGSFIIIGIVTEEIEFRWDTITQFTLYFTAIVSLIIFITLYIRAGYGKRKTGQLREIASAIEDTEKNNRLIMKADKVGVYDWKRRSVLLPVEYDSIEWTDSIYYKVEKAGKYGVFSLPLNRFILECKYDDVSPFVNNVATIIHGGVKERVDTQGNIF